jgi:hypothetical protein
MADIKIAYGSAFDLTITSASLASDTNLLAGRSSAAIDNTSDKFLDFLIGGKATTGTSPTTGRSIQYWAVASWDGTLWPDVFDGTDKDVTISLAQIKNSSVCRLIDELATVATSNEDYYFGGVSIARLFGSVPPKFQIFQTHNTVANLNATAGNHVIRVQPVYRTV